MKIWRKRQTIGQRSSPAASSRPSARTGRGGAPRAQGSADAGSVIDLRDDIGWAASVEVNPARRAELAALHRERKAKAEAAADLRRLRARHWSGERLVEESRYDAEWWEHAEADPYAVLGLLPGASLEDAASARRRVAKQCHPDAAYLCEDDHEAARQRMIAANSAYDRIRRALRV